MSNLQRVDFVNKTVLPEKEGGHMADLSNGYTKTANEIQKLKPRLRMSGREWQCFEAVIWLTYGWNKKQDRVTNTVIAELTGLSDTHVSDAIKALAERKIIFSQKQGMMKLVGVNAEISAWILDKPETGTKIPKTGKSFPKEGKRFPKTVDTQYKNKNSNKPPISPKGESPKFNPLSVPIPEWLDSQAWSDWVNNRNETKKPIKTERGVNAAFKLLKECLDEGHDPAAVINNSIANGYQGLFKPKFPLKKTGVARPSRPMNHIPEGFTG
ncbi:replication protein [Pectobacterium odoriferum]|uniref:replication protein n=1 Tax=Pectobacterium odoriferum TaxID=78398 RepID=UPI000B309426|nr:replication protein [Pectobacterium odoriferum]